MAKTKQKRTFFAYFQPATTAPSPKGRALFVYSNSHQRFTSSELCSAVVLFSVWLVRQIKFPVSVLRHKFFPCHMLCRLRDRNGKKRTKQQRDKPDHFILSRRTTDFLFHCRNKTNKTASRQHHYLKKLSHQTTKRMLFCCQYFSPASVKFTASPVPMRMCL